MHFMTLSVSEPQKENGSSYEHQLGKVVVYSRSSKCIDSKVHMSKDKVKVAGLSKVQTKEASV